MELEAVARRTITDVIVDDMVSTGGTIEAAIPPCTTQARWSRRALPSHMPS
jgi:hypothetical protein